MSKAFTRELDDVPERFVPPRAMAGLPPGIKNLITPAGALRIRQELERMVEQERPQLAASSDPAAKRQLQALDQRIHYLQYSLNTAVVTGPPEKPHDVVRFGATVSVRDGAGEETTYRIVGANETDLDRDWVSWLSPIAKALLNARVGQRVPLKLPGGDQELEILSVNYE